MFGYASPWFLIDTFSAFGLFGALLMAGGLLLAVLYMRSVRQTQGDVEPEWMKAGSAAKHDPRGDANLAINPFGPKDSGVALGPRITDAAELCVTYGRKAIVISIVFDALGPEALPPVAETAKRVVRKTDLVHILSDAELIVCLAMVQDFSAAGQVTERLREAFAQMPQLRGVTIASGAAIYPMHGYSGEELLDAARRNARRWPSLLTR